VSKSEDLVTLKVEKQKDAEPIEDLSFEMTQVALVDDVSVVMLPSEREGKKRRAAKLTPEQDIALQALRNESVRLGRERVPVNCWHDAHKAKTPDVASGKRRDARSALQNKRVIVIDGGEVWEYKELRKNV